MVCWWHVAGVERTSLLCWTWTTCCQRRLQTGNVSSLTYRASTGDLPPLIGHAQLPMTSRLVRSKWPMLSASFCVIRYDIEVGWYIENITDISPISIYWYRYHISTLNIGFFFDISISHRGQVKYRYFLDILSYFFRLFNVNLKTDNCMSIRRYTSLHLY